MLEIEIAALRERLNRLIAKGVSLDRLYGLSVRLDGLILEYYRKKYKGRKQK